ncbi:MAG: HNH endonuclease, partial [Chloroflexi bacterium]|nr:HNH endonuclease [Chloroflexota bacterium]
MIDAAKALAIAERAKMAPSRRLRIMQRDNFHCVFCGRGREDGIKLHVDHIVPIAKGGKTEDDNLAALTHEGIKIPEGWKPEIARRLAMR